MRRELIREFIRWKRRLIAGMIIMASLTIVTAGTALLLDYQTVKEVLAFTSLSTTTFTLLAIAAHLLERKTGPDDHPPL